MEVLFEVLDPRLEVLFEVLDPSLEVLELSPEVLELSLEVPSLELLDKSLEILTSSTVFEGKQPSFEVIVQIKFKYEEANTWRVHDRPRTWG